jgi:hypothetical protein
VTNVIEPVLYVYVPKNTNMDDQGMTAMVPEESMFENNVFYGLTDSCFPTHLETLVISDSPRV